jgi:hypothetical protein
MRRKFLIRFDPRSRTRSRVVGEYVVNYANGDLLRIVSP